MVQCVYCYSSSGSYDEYRLGGWCHMTMTTNLQLEPTALCCESTSSIDVYYYYLARTLIPEH